MLCILSLIAVAAQSESPAPLDPDRKDAVSGKTGLMIDDPLPASSSISKINNDTGDKGKDAALSVPQKSVSPSKSIAATVAADEKTTAGGSATKAKPSASIQPSGAAVPAVEPARNDKKKTGTEKAVKPVAKPTEVRRREPVTETRRPRPDRYLARAQEFYMTGKFPEAVIMVKRSLKANPMNEAALAFQKKIDRVQEKMAYARVNMVNEYYCSAEYLFRKGFVLDARLEINKALAIDPSAKDALLLSDEINRVNAKMLEKVSPKYRAKFEKAIRRFVEGDIEMASKILRKLQNDTAEAEYFLPVILAHLSDNSNRARSDEYYSEALRQVNKGRYHKAHDNLYLAIAMDKNNLDARLLQVQIDAVLAENY
jgi:hypothetical protein